MLQPKLISGFRYEDERGVLLHNNNADFSLVKRCYIIENSMTKPIKAWQGHKIEQRWFIPIVGILVIKLIEIDNWISPNKFLPKLKFTLSSNSMNVLHIPQGYVTSIESLEPDSKLLVMSDHRFKEIEDDYRYPIDYFTS
jgi:hypothetical protein